MCRKKVSRKVKEVKNLEIFYCNWSVEKMAKKFILQDDGKFCIFVIKDKKQAVILTMSYIELQTKVIWQQKWFGISYPWL